MNLIKKTALLLALVVTGLVVTDSALAHGGRVHTRVGVFVGIPIGFGWPYSYYPPYPYYYPAYPSQVVVVPSQPQTYIQQDGTQAAPAPQQGYWYYCTDARAYYPYVKECPGGWQRVAPQPPS